MDQSGYRDKSYLLTYELTTDIFEEYNILVDDIVPIRSVYMLYTDRGMKILKKINYKLIELEFINSVMEYVSTNGYKYVVPFMKTESGNYYIEREDGIYVILNLVEGREADFQNPIDVDSVSKVLNCFHRSTSGIEYVLESRNNLYKWIPTFEKRSLELLKFKEIALLHEIKSSFDRLFLKYVDKYYKDSLKSIELLRSSSYEDLCNDTMKIKNICHHDLAYHNIIVGNDGNIYFVDFDYCILDLRVHDIANLIVKAIKKCSWDIEKACSILDSYCYMDGIKKVELEVLYGFMVFPQDFYDICRCYYMKTKKWDEDDFLPKLESKTNCYNDRKLFLEEFGERIKKRVT